MNLYTNASIFGLPVFTNMAYVLVLPSSAVTTKFWASSKSTAMPFSNVTPSIAATAPSEMEIVGTNFCPATLSGTVKYTRFPEITPIEFSASPSFSEEVIDIACKSLPVFFVGSGPGSSSPPQE